MNDLRRVIGWLSRSSIHADWTVQDIERLVVPCVERGQYVLTENGFATWAFLTPEAAKGFVERTRRLRSEDLSAGEELWILDMVAPGFSYEVVRAIRKKLGKRAARWCRGYGTGRTVKIGKAYV